VTLLDACRSVMRDDHGDKYPDGLDSADVLAEIRAKFGADAFPLCTVIDVANEMRAFFGVPSRG
jgi:hypothetical protein